MGLRGNVPIEGVRIVPYKRANGGRRYYYYAYRDADTSFWQTDDFKLDLSKDKLPRDFVEAYTAASKPDGPAEGTFGKLVNEYLSEPNSPYHKLAAATKKDRRKYIDRVRDMRVKDGRLAVNAPVSTFDNKAMRRWISAWHNEMASTPKAADETLVALSAILSYGKAKGDLLVNICHGMPKMYERPTEDARVWTEDEQENFFSDAHQHLRLAAMFIRYTGLRRKDAVEIEAAAQIGDYLVWRASKSRRRKKGEAGNMAIPILPQLRPVLAELAVLRAKLAASPTTLLFNSRGRPWTPDGFSASFNKHRARHQISATIHGLRKNAATDWIIYQREHPTLISDDDICAQFDWTRADLKKMKRIYVNDTAVIRAITGTEQKRNLERDWKGK